MCRGCVWGRVVDTCSRSVGGRCVLLIVKRGEKVMSTYSSGLSVCFSLERMYVTLLDRGDLTYDLV